MDTAEHSEPKRKVRMVVLLEPWQRQKLDALASATGAPLGELVRRSLNDYLTNYFNSRELERVSA
jgi:Ribbon-helix-helix domain